MQAINRWIVIAKHIVHSSKRRQRDEKQNKLTKHLTLTITKFSKPIQSNVNKSERKLLQRSMTTLVTTKTASPTRWNDIVHPRLSLTTTTVFLTVRQPIEWKCILKSINKFGSDSSDQNQPSEARLPTTPTIPLTIANTPNLTVILKVTYNDKQQAVKIKRKINFDQRSHSFSNSIISTNDDTRKNHVCTDNSSPNVTLISHVSKNNNRPNPNLTTCNYRRKPTNLVLPKHFSRKYR